MNELACSHKTQDKTWYSEFFFSHPPNGIPLCFIDFPRSYGCYIKLALELPWSSSPLLISLCDLISSNHSTCLDCIASVVNVARRT